MSEKKQVSSSHKRTITKTYLTLMLTFTILLGLNVYAYLTITEMSNVYSSLNNATTTIKLQTLTINLLFREALTGKVAQDMNEVWTELESAKINAKPLSEIGSEHRITGALEKLRAIILDTYNIHMEPLEVEDENGEIIKVDSVQREKEKKESMGLYVKRFNHLIANINSVKGDVETLVKQKMSTFKTTYIALFTFIILLFFFTLLTIRSYVIKRKTKEMHLQETKENLYTIIDSIDSLLITVNAEGIVFHWNAEAAKRFGISPERASGQGIEELIPFMSNYLDNIERVFHSRKLEKLYREQISEDIDNFYDITFTYIQGVDKVLLKLDDITNSQLKEDQLRQTQKMEVVENLITNLAHDFNNVLGAITGTITMMRYSLENRETTLEDIQNSIDVIENSAERAVVMVGQLLVLATKDDSSPSPVDLNTSIRHVVKICKNTMAESIELRTETYATKAMAEIDPAQIEQVLLTLCDNASEAMTTMRDDDDEQGGCLSIEVNRVCPDKSFRNIHPKAVKHSYWIISIKDTGVGMDHETLSKIFDPFFTTKDEEGTGLGLTMVAETLQQSGGFIEAISSKRKGTTFYVYIPELDKDTESEESEVVPVEGEQIPTGSGTIFVVDDELIMRKTAGNILKKLGYDVLFAEDGEEAVAIFQEHRENIKLTLLDMAMPKMSGKEAYIEMRKFSPDLKVLLLSGFKSDNRIQDVLDMGVNGFIQKPYSMITLAQEIATIIGGNEQHEASDDEQPIKENPLLRRINNSGTVIMELTDQDLPPID